MKPDQQEIARRLLDVALDTGAHSDPEKGMCVMEAVAWMAGEKFSDAPRCACPLLASFLRRLNDRLPAEPRQLLKELIPLLIGSRGGYHTVIARVFHLADYSARVFAPWALDRLGYTEAAAKLRGMIKITTRADAAACREAAREILSSLPTLDRALDRALALALDRARALALALDLDRALALDLDRALALDLDRALALALDRALALDLDRALALDLALDLDLDRDLARDLDLALALARDLARSDSAATNKLVSLAIRCIKEAVAIRSPEDDQPQQ